ncbi:MAG: uroporphyrinogen decarboxylase family protein [Clostridia bacterium]
MDARERVLRTLEFRGPDRLPLDLWVLPAAVLEHGEALEQLLAENENDITGVAGPHDMGANPQYYERGTMTDEWGNGWLNLQGGMIGEVKHPALEDFSRAAAFEAPTQSFVNLWAQQEARIQADVASQHERGKFVCGGGISLFERMQYLRGTEALYCDIADGGAELDTILGIVMDYYRVYVEHWLGTDVDGICFGDDWGCQRSLLIRPDAWRELFKPLYAELISKIKATGKKVLFHSDGYIMDIYPDLIDMGVDAINSQLWCMDIGLIAKRYAGKITFRGEISRQTTIPFGTPEDIRGCIKRMKQLFDTGKGGLIAQSEVGGKVPFENIETLLSAWYSA